ncbi:MAG: TonB-dependent receptor [Sulfurimonas sp.]|uniref:TonB-dependent receptor n=1 Tax=Sulfurimonas sp. TaxID=2022749 RepID=UPI0025FB279C|nr:TonB-dependent receptor [Sulfurimonas sp.]MCK9492215.1 TonB-dependent receptor [Sulfurimonas sp.]
MKKEIKLSLILVALMSSLQAETSNTIVLKPLSVTSTAIKTDELRSTDAVEIYTQEDIEKTHVQNMYEFLNSHTSIVATPSYGNPFSQKLDMRGFGNDGYQNIVVTINGRKMNNIDGVPQMLSSISPSSVSRIEIIKSSGIVVGGDGANAGVINIVTKKNNDKEFSFYLGSYGLADGSFYIGHKDEKLSVSASAEAQKSNGTREIDSEANKDENKFSTGSLDLAYFVTDKLELSLGASFARTDVFYAGAMTKDQYNNNPNQKGFGGVNHQKYDSNALNAGIKYYINDKLSLNANVSQEKKKSIFLPPSWPYEANYDYKSLLASIDYASDTLSIKLGVDGFDGDRKGSDNTTSKNNKAVYIMTNYRLGNSSFKAGYRLENVAYIYDAYTTHLKQDDNLYGAELGYNYLINKESSVFANFTHSFLSPDIDRFFATTYPPPTFTPTVSFNGFIKPSKVDTYSLGYNNINKDNKFKISFYYADLKDEIYMQPITFKNTNIDKSYKYGVDLYDKYIISPEFSLALNYNYVQAIIDKEKEGSSDYSGNKLPGVSNHNVKATLGYTPNRATTINLTQSYRSKAYAADDFNNNFSQKQDAYMTTDISIAYAKESWEVFAKINNLFNQKNGLWIYDNAIYPINFTTTALAGFKLKY